MNLYIQDTLNLARRRKYNKVILISNIPIHREGKYFAEEARKILGFNAVVLFHSFDENHLNEQWLKDFPNALFSNKKELSN